MIFSSIYGRSESRTYTKPIVERESKYDLSPEEKEAIRLAMQSKEKGALPGEARDVEHEEKIANLRLFHDKKPLEQPVRLESRAEPEERPQRPTTVMREQPARKPDAEGEPERRKAAGPGKGRTRPKGATVSARKKRPGRVTHVGTSGGRSPESTADRAKETGPSRGEMKPKADRDRIAPGEPVKKPAPLKSSRREPDAQRLKGLDNPVERPLDRKPGDS